ncbi:proline iminopeptidase [Pseudoglutamicibacter albus]|uniref:Proline iminopeptidase n=1 Tax=Pseudoglutamicibacter albus TaxID=98671 RepID=A0ABU1Z060_9MICC|nr:alpha/beta fold hydrolase [Pseudoglutamicibacter albus]MDR7293386.1 proline iminopeptidase [Pseudoglutamicibacter albus]
MTPLTPRPAKLLRRDDAAAWRGAVVSSVLYEVPLVHGTEHLAANSSTHSSGASLDAQSVTVRAREVRSIDADAEQRPWLVYLQGGPGFEALRPVNPSSGWLGELLPHFRVLLLDQRGTGGSSPISAATLNAIGSGEPEPQQITRQIEFLSHFRATDIVADAEAIRLAMGVDSWFTLGQSYGGFITMSYLSFAPDALAGSMITGGLGLIEGDPKRVYDATYARTAERQAEVFEAWPHAAAQLRDLYAEARRARDAGHPYRLANGHVVTELTIQRLGMLLGGNSRVQQLRFGLEDALSHGGISPVMLSLLGSQVDHARNPIYWLFQEAIYTSGPATRWAASRSQQQTHPQTLPSADVPQLIGEAALPEDFEQDPALQPLEQLAHALHEYSGWSPLYNYEQLANNTVPVAAAVYTPDIYVDRELSLETASRIRGINVWESADHHHDGLSDDPATVLGELRERIGR